MKVWKGIERWLGIEIILNTNCLDSFNSFGRSTRKEFGKKMRSIFWVTTLWFIWIDRNNSILRGEVFNLEDTLNYIKFHSWRWLFQVLV